MNPNYAPSNKTFHGGLDIRCYGNMSVMSGSGSCNELETVKNRTGTAEDISPSNISLYRKEDTQSLTDSAISSPSSDSSLSSPCATAADDQNLSDKRETDATGTGSGNRRERGNKQQDGANL